MRLDLGAAAVETFSRGAILRAMLGAKVRARPALSSNFLNTLFRNGIQVVLGSLLCGGLVTPASGWELTGQIAAEARAFAEDAILDGKHGFNTSLAIAPELYHEWAKESLALTVSPFARIDQGDEERTHLDLREAFLLYSGDHYEVRAGVRQVFWGVAESQHLVDIVGQTDLIENPDGEDKLGQPMMELTLLPSFGVIELSALIGSRERTFPGTEGRLGTIPVADGEYESSAEEWHIGWAGRWSHYLGPFDFGLSHFQGTSREPVLRFDPNGTTPSLIPYYPLIDQTGIDLQATLGGWLWKLEAIRRAGFGPKGHERTFTAAVGGFEYTLVGVGGSVYDLGLIAEMHLDDRGDDATTPFQDDIFVGARLVLNDVMSTDCLAGVVIDRTSGTVFSSVEASRRVGDRWRVYLEYRGFGGLEKDDPLYGIRNDDHLQIEIVRFF